MLPPALEARLSRADDRGAVDDKSGANRFNDFAQPLASLSAEGDVLQNPLVRMVWVRHGHNRSLDGAIF